MSSTKKRLTFASYALVELFCVVGLIFVALQEVDVDIEAASLAIGDWMNELVVGFALRFCWWIGKRFAVF